MVPPEALNVKKTIAYVQAQKQHMLCPCWCNMHKTSCDRKIEKRNFVYRYCFTTKL